MPDSSVGHREDRVWRSYGWLLLIWILLTSALADDSLHRFSDPNFNQAFFKQAVEALEHKANLRHPSTKGDARRREIRRNTIETLKILQGTVCQEIAAAIYQRIEAEIKTKKPDVKLLQNLLVTYLSVSGEDNKQALRLLEDKIGTVLIDGQPLLSDQQLKKLVQEGINAMTANGETTPLANELIDLKKLQQDDPLLTFFDIVNELRSLTSPIDEEYYHVQDNGADLTEANDPYAYLDELEGLYRPFQNLATDHLMAVDEYGPNGRTETVTISRTNGDGDGQAAVTHDTSNVSSLSKLPLGNEEERTIREILLDATARDAMADLLTEASERERLQRLAPTGDYLPSPQENLDQRPVPLDKADKADKAAARQGYQRRFAKGMTPKKWKDDLRQRMGKDLIGQDDVIERLLDLENTISNFGEHKKPPVMILMGAPGTGKDTAVRAYVNALHAKENAWQDHLYVVNPMLSKADLWKHLGSATGYTGSESLPPLVKFLVEHSSGRYQLEEISSTDKSSKKYKVVEVPKRQRDAAANPPYSAVLFLNEFQNWSKDLKDLFLKPVLENGLFEVSDPKGGERLLQVPVTIIIATNEGTELVAARESNGNRFGKPLTYEQQIEKYEKWKNDPSALKEALARTNGAANGSMRSEDAKGISEELLNKFPDSGFVLMRPLSPESLRQIAQIKMTEIKDKFAHSLLPALRQMKLTWTDKLLQFVQEYHYIAEENARPIEDRVLNLIQANLFRILESNDLAEIADASTLAWELNLDVEKLADKTWNLVATVKKDAGSEIVVRQLIDRTLADKAVAPITDERLDELIQIKEKLGTQVFGVEDVLARLTKAITIGEEGRARGAHESEASMPARSFMFLGLSSTGKTETAKALAEALYGDRLNAVTIDFSQVQTINDLKTKILGGDDGLGNPIPSEFMKHFDRLQGKVLFIFDELANTPRDVLKALYDILREPVVTTFSDGRHRAMQSVCIIMTGNIGEEYFFRMPADLSLHMQRLAMEEIYASIVARPEFMRNLLLQHFSPALLNRIGERNIFFFPPLSLRAQRQLTLHKLAKAVQSLEPQEGRRGWFITFGDEQNFGQFMDALEDASLIPREQGASIDRYITQDWADELRYFLLQEKVPSNLHVDLRLANIERQEENGANPVFYQKINLQVKIEGRATPLNFVLHGPKRPLQPEHRRIDLMKTALHEAGHQIADQTFFKDVHVPRYVSIIPGVSNDFDDLVVYLGISSHHNAYQVPLTRGKVLRMLATLLAGTTAQELTSVAASEDAGKSNDIQVASRLAYNAVLRWGLSPAWGNAAIGDNVEIASYIATLSEDKRRLLEREVQALLKEGHHMAAQSIYANYETFLSLGRLLLARGQLNAQQLKDFYASHILLTEAQLAQAKWNPSYWMAKLKLWWQQKHSSNVRDLRFRENVFQENPEIVDLEKLFITKKNAEVSKVPIPAAIKFAMPATADKCAAQLLP